ncbi:LysR family transcriptional regulator [Ruegeria pomeroyi]|nr:LysR family transcriptional regulator [Ruegeria pomeroyi]
MQLDWIDDILAVIDTGSLAAAAERRLLTQPAFTRRVRGIEERIGAALFDRSRKPVAVLPGVLALEPELRELSGRLRRLQQDLRVSAEDARRGVTLVCQHAITTTISPWIVRDLTASQDISVRVRSGNRDECLMLLLSGEADFAVAYEVPGERDPMLPQAFDRAELETDLLVPVHASGLETAEARTAMPVIGYPPDVFLGQVFDRFVAPRLPAGFTYEVRAETALTLAACEYALGGIGVAWLPLTLVAPHLAAGRLCRAEGLPDQPLTVTLMRLSGGSPRRSDQSWQMLSGQPGPS